MNKEWLKELDYFRGFAILGVIAIHSFVLPPPSLLNYYIGYQDSPITDLIRQTVISFTGFAIPLFILISGIALAYKYYDKINIFDFYKKRLLRIIPPYVFISLISIFFLGLLNQMPSFGTIIFKLLTGTASDPLWFVAVILQLYIIFPFIFIRIIRWQRESSNFFILFPAIAFLIQFIWFLSRPALSIYFLSNGPGDFLNSFFLGYFFYFVIGIYFGLYYKETISLIRSFSILVLLVFCLGQYLLHYYQQYSPSLEYVLSLMFIISYIILIIRLTLVIIERKSHLESFIYNLGVISFGIYLIHPFFNYFFWIVLSKSTIDPSNYIYSPLIFLLLVISSVLAIQIFLRVPYHKWLIGV